MLIRAAEVDAWREGGVARIVDVRIAGGRIAAIGAGLPRRGDDEPLIDAGGAALLPGLHDHHLHLYALAAALDSLPCGPPEVRDAEALRGALHARAADLGSGEWLRGTGYHESLCGLLDAATLDAIVRERPLLCW